MKNLKCSLEKKKREGGSQMRFKNAKKHFLNKIVVLIVLFFCVGMIHRLDVSAEESSEAQAAVGTYSVQAASAGNAIVPSVSISENTVTITGEVSVTNGASDGMLEFVYLNGGSTETRTYTIPASKDVVIKQSGYSTLNFNLDNNEGLSSIKIEVANVTTTMGSVSEETMNLSGTDIEIEAEKVLFDATYPVTLLADDISIVLKADFETEFVLSKIAAKSLKASFKNFNVKAEGAFAVDADVKESTIAEETKDSVNWGEDVIEYLDLLDGSTKYFASVRPIYINVPIENSNIEATDILLDLVTDIVMKTKTINVPVAVNIGVLHNKVHVSGNSSLNATNGNIKINAVTKISSEAKTEATEKLSFGAAITIVNHITEAIITGNTKLSATGSIDITTDNNIEAIATANGHKDSQDKSGVYSTITVVNQESVAEISGNASAECSELNVLAKHASNATTTATSGAVEKEETNNEEEKKDIKDYSVSDIIKLLSQLKVEDENGEKKAAVSEKDTKEVEKKLNEAGEAGSEEEKVTEKETETSIDKGTVKITVVDKDGKAVSGATVKISGEGMEDKTAKTTADGTVTFTGLKAGKYKVAITEGVPKGYNVGTELEVTLEETKGYAGEIKLAEKTSDTQMVGSLAILVGNSKNYAFISTTGTVKVSGNVNVNADGFTHYETTADGSANSESATSIGTGIVVAVVTLDNKAYVKNVTLEATDLDVSANSGCLPEDASDDAIVAGSSAIANAGFSAGQKMGLGGAITVHVYNASTSALIENAAMTLAGATSINAIDVSNTTTEALANGKSNAESKGVGAGIAIAVNSNVVEAILGQQVTFTKVDGAETSLTIYAESTGETSVKATAGAAGGTSVAPVIALDVTNVSVTADVQSNDTGVSSAGDVSVTSKSKRINKVLSDASAAGSKVAVGAALSIGVVNVETKALLDREVLTAANVTVKASSSNEATSEAKAGANGAKAEESKDEGEAAPASEEEKKEDGEASKSIDKVLKAGSKVAGGEDKCPSKSPQKPETSEGQVSVGAALSLVISKGITHARISESVTASEAVELVTETEKDYSAIADASATNSTTGVGVAVGILVVNANNKVELTEDAVIEAGSFKLASVMPEGAETEETETVAEGEEKVTLGNGTNDITVKTTSGAGTSNVGVAGSLAIAVINMTYEAEVPADVTAEDTVEVLAQGKNQIHAFAGASTVKEDGKEGEAAKKSTGVGASFAIMTANLNATARILDVEVEAGGKLTVKAESESEVLTQTETGAKGKAEEAASQSTGEDTSVAIGMTVAVISGKVIAGLGEGSKVTAGEIEITSNNKVNSEIKAGAAAEAEGLAVGVSLVVDVVNMETVAELAGEVETAGDITVSTSDEFRGSIQATGGGNGASGAYIAIVVVNQDAKANVVAGTKVVAGGLSVKSVQTSVTDIDAVSGSGEEKEEGESEESITFGEALEKAGKVETTDENGEKKQAVSAEDLETAENKFNEAAESAEEETATEGEEPATKEPASKSQFVGAVAVVVGSIHNGAEIIGEEGKETVIELSGSLTVEGEALVSYASEADGSAVVPVEGEETVDKSVGVAVVVQVVTASNKAEVEYVSVEAEDVTVTATSGRREGEEAVSGSSAVAKAGFSAGNFGLGGAIAVNVYTAETKASVNHAELAVTGITSIHATETSNVTTEALASCQNEGEVSKDSTGVGAGIAIGVNTNTISAILGSEAEYTGNNGGLSVLAESLGETSVKATAGAAGGTSVAPVIALDVTNVSVTADVQSNDTGVSSAGDVSVTSKSKRINKVLSDASAAGSKVAVGAALSIGVVNVETKALLDREVLTAANVTVKASSSNEATSEAKAGANGAKAEESKDEGEAAPASEEEKKEDGEASKSIDKVLKAGSKVAGGEDKCPSKSPQKPETSEGQVSVGAALSLVISKGITHARISESVTASEAVELVTETEKDYSAIADASATNSTTGVGVAVGILVVNANNKVELTEDAVIEAGSFKLASVMPEGAETEETETVAEGEEKVTLGNGTNDITVKTTSGAGTSNVGVAGSLAIAVINMTYEAEVPADVTAEDTVEVLAQGKNQIHAFAGASTVKEDGKEGEAAKKSTGVGASFAIMTANLNATARILDVEVEAGGKLTVKAESESEVLTQTETGAKGKAEEAASQSTGEDTSVAIGMTVAVISGKVIAGLGEGSKVTAGEIEITSNNKVNSEIKAGAAAEAEGLAVGVSLVVDVVNMETVAELAGEVETAGDITVSTSDEFRGSIQATGGGNGASGAYIAIVVVNQDAKANVVAGTKVVAGGLSVKSVQTSVTDIDAVSGSGEEKEEGESEESITFGEALEKAGKVETTDENGEKKQAVSAEDLETAENKFNEAAESAEEETATEGEEPATKEPASKSQFVGAVAVVVGSIHNGAEIIGEEGKETVIELSGSLTVEGEALVSYASEADGSAVVPVEGEETVDKSVGVAVVVQVVTASNKAEVEYVSVEAEDVTVTATSGRREGEEAVSGSSAVAKAGFSAGNFGLGGAIVVNVSGFETRAFIGTADIKLGGTDSSDLKVISVENEKVTSKALTTQGNEDGKVGIGAGISVSVANVKSIAEIGTAIIEGVNAITVDATSTSNVEVYAEAGAAGGTAVVPVLALNINYSEVTARIQKALKVEATGNVAITINADNTSDTEANAAVAGEKAAIGGAFAIAVNTFNNNAELKRALSADSVVVASDVKVNAINNAKASAKGADGEEAEEDNKKAASEDTNTNEKKENESEKGSAANIVDNALKSGQKVSGDTKNVPNKSPQKPETSEGTITVAGSLALEILNVNTSTNIEGDVESEGDVSVVSNNHVDASVKADSSATVSETGVGVAVGILVANVKTDALVVGNVEADNLTVSAQITEKDDSVEDQDTTSTFEVESISGAGGAKAAVAGSVSINVTNIDYVASVDGNVAADGNIIVNADLARDLSSKAGTSSYEDGAVAGKQGASFGVGASFSLITSSSKANALIGENHVVTAGGDLSLNAQLKNNTDNSAIAGEDGYPEEETEVTDGELEIVIQDSDGNGIKGVELTVYKDGKKDDKKYETDENGSFKLDVTLGSDEDTSRYDILLEKVPEGYLLPEQTKYVININSEAKGWIKEIELKRVDETEKEDPKKNFSLDAAVAVNVVDADVAAIVGNGTVINVAGNLTLGSTTEGSSKAYTEGCSSSSNSAVGASVNVNVIYQAITADFAGSGAVGGNVEVKASSATNDVSEAFATASGVDLDRYTKKFNTSVDNIMNGVFGNDSKDSKEKTEEVTSKSTATNDKISKALYKNSDKKADSGKNVAAAVLDSQDVKTQKVETSGVANGSTDIGTDSNTSDVKADGKDKTSQSAQSKPDKNMTVAAAVGANIVSYKVNAGINGNLTNAGNVDVSASNTNNFQTLGTGASVSKKTAIAAGVAVIVNNSEAIATINGQIGNGAENTYVGNVTVGSVTENNIGDGFKNQIAAEAIAGAAKGKEEGGTAVAGAI